VNGGDLSAQIGEMPQIKEALLKGDTGSFIILLAEKWRKAESEERSRVENFFMETIPWMSRREAFNLLSGRLLDLREAPSKKILLLLPLKGSLKPLAEAFLRGFKLGISPSIRIEVQDVSSGLSEAKNLMRRESQALVVGPLTSQGGKAISSLARQSLVPVILPTAEDVRLEARPLLFLMEGGFYTETEAVVRFAVDSLGITKFVSLVPNSALGLSVSYVFRDLVSGLGAKVLWTGVYEEDSTNFSRIVERIKILNPEGIFFPFATKRSLILASQIRADSILCPFFGLHNWGEEDARRWSKRGVDSVFVFTPFTAASGIREKSRLLVENQRFRQRYISLYEEDPPPFSRKGYDTARFIMKIFSEKGFLSALEAWDSINRKGLYFGISGRYLISKDRRFIKIYRLTNGRLKKI